MNATLKMTKDNNRSGNDAHNAKVVARLTASMENKIAWREIERILSEAGYRGVYLATLRDEVWRIRKSKVSEPQTPRSNP